VIDQAAMTRTFVITDIEGSTRLWEEHHEAVAPALEVHDRLLAAAVTHSGGIVVKTTGDGLLAVFDAVDAAIGAALEGQRALAAHDWGATGPLRVRMAIHTGAAHHRDDDYFGPVVNRVARLLAIGHGGQVLLSGASRALLDEARPGEYELVDRGEHRLRDLDRPERVFEVQAAGLAREFPPLRSLEGHLTNLPIQLTSFVTWSAPSRHRGSCRPPDGRPWTASVRALNGQSRASGRNWKPNRPLSPEQPVDESPERRRTPYRRLRGSLPIVFGSLDRPKLRVVERRTVGIGIAGVRRRFLILAEGDDDRAAHDRATSHSHDVLMRRRRSPVNWRSGDIPHAD